MRVLLLTTGVILGLCFAEGASAESKTIGADLSRPATNTRTCETGFFDPALIAGTGFPYQPFASCTWWSVGGLQAAASAIVPYGGGTVRKVRVKVGPITGRMQVVALRLMRNPSSLADPGCCFPAGSGPVFIPDANAITELDVDIPVKHGTDPATGIVNYDVLALSVLDAGVPIPAQATNDGGWSGVVAGMFPAYRPGEERTVGYGSVMAGHVLLAADVEPPAKTTTTTTNTTTTTTTTTTTEGLPPTVPPDADFGGDRPTVRSGAVRMKVRCNAPAGCKGQVVLTRRGVVYGRATISMAAGKTTTVRVPLSRAGRRALRTGRTLTAQAKVQLGRRTVATRKLTLKLRRA